MWGRSLAFDEAIRQSHTVVSRADALLGGLTIATGLAVLDGFVDVDKTAGVRRRCSVTVVDTDGTLSGSPSAVLSPYGREVRLYRGIRFPDGSTETVVLGTFRIARVSVNDTGGDRRVTVTGFDRSRSVSRARFESPYTVAAGTNYATAIRELLQSRLANIETEFESTSRTTPLLVFDQASDPWQAATDMAESIGCELFFSPMGVCVLRTIPSTDAAVSWDYGEGSGAVVLSVDNTLSDEPGYNGVVVDGEPTNAPPVHAVVYDTDPNSPTFVDGAYGRVPRFYRSQLVTTQEQAEDAALGILAREKGGTEQLRFSAVPHPAHEVDDVVRVVDAAIDIDDTYTLEAFSIPLGLGHMTATTRKRRV